MSSDGPWVDGAVEHDNVCQSQDKALLGPTAQEDPLHRTLQDTRGWKAGLAFAIVLGISPAIYLMKGKPNSNRSAQASVDASISAPTRTGPTEIDTGAMCDLAVKRSLVLEDSFDPEMGGSFYAEGNIGNMSRKFNATNGFGGELTSRYFCKWDSVNDRIISLTITDPFGGITRVK